jgi:hypothetical protein
MTHFTVDQANAALPEIRELLEQLRRSIRAFEEFRGSSEEEEEEETPDSDSPVSPGYFRLVASFHHALHRIQEIGCEIKDVQRGVVDFPTEIDGEEAFLCWAEGDDRVRYWHSADDGYENRQLLPD